MVKDRTYVASRHRVPEEDAGVKAIRTISEILPDDPGDTILIDVSSLARETNITK